MTAQRRLLTFIAAIPLLVVGSRITLHGVNVKALADFMGAGPGGRGGLLGLYEMVFQGGLTRGAILGLGIMPYLSARIFMRLARVVIPSVQPSKFATRVLTVALSLIQSTGLAVFLQGAPGVVAEPGPGFIAKTMLTLTAGSLVAMWFGEQLTEPLDSDLDDPEVSGLPERLSGAPALISPAPPASQPVHQRPSSDAETLRTSR